MTLKVSFKLKIQVHRMWSFRKMEYLNADHLIGSRSPQSRQARPLRTLLGHIDQLEMQRIRLFIHRKLHKAASHIRLTRRNVSASVLYVAKLHAAAPA
jgi:hypothetical protein